MIKCRTIYCFRILSYYSRDLSSEAREEERRAKAYRVRLKVEAAATRFWQTRRARRVRRRVSRHPHRQVHQRRTKTGETNEAYSTGDKSEEECRAKTYRAMSESKTSEPEDCA